MRIKKKGFTFTDWTVEVACVPRYGGTGCGTAFEVSRHDVFVEYAEEVRHVIGSGGLAAFCFCPGCGDKHRIEHVLNFDSTLPTFEDWKATSAARWAMVQLDQEQTKEMRVRSHERYASLKRPARS